ncbi:pyridoxine/pyridoxamine 5'-phosphate oxidase [Pengzhenrongella frigida]|uniref:Pyridoxal 5'-phosphate synthase n=1 Tax=Pengzhenrongella frigida TaxID=1259133 RepID=A0A4Q5N0E7_9MICO|nr:pyridoxal 5'-phosphate synthase [Cellulomonas sp. HLT2-17]RYV49471.1 pyridoxal 5'-phosphate synthase [Cellulomonas sp. HLT2-17]
MSRPVTGQVSSGSGEGPTAVSTAPTSSSGSLLRQTLRGLPVFAGELPAFDPATVPDDPIALFVAWIGAAIEAGVAEPHAMTLATADAGGAPSARVVILKDVHDGGWEFATDARSRKAADVARNPLGAVTFYWQLQARQVRLRGSIVARGPRVSAADFLSRSPASRAAAFAVRPGEPLGSPAELEAALADALVMVERAPEQVLAEWTLQALVPLEIEFWQGDRRRAHTRVVYRRDAVGEPWRHELVWP